MLEQAARRPVTVLSAPAGYGKTTALVQWITRSGIDYAWLLLHARDNDPNRFAARLLDALARTVPGDVHDAERALRAGSDLGATVVPLTVNALAKRADRLAIVLDDYHVLTEPGCHEFARDLIETVPASVSVLVASRTVPPLRLARRRANDDLAEIGPDQLRFKGDESRRLLNGSLGLDLERQQIESIQERVQGWPAGVALIGGALTGKPDAEQFLEAMTVSGTSLDAYLVEEVLETVKPEMRAFLWRTSILDSLCATGCEAVYGNPNAQELLDEVKRMNLFVTPVDPESTWVRYHQPFAETLRRELARREPQLIGELHLRASRWFEEHHMPEDSIEHAIAASDGRRAAALLADNWAVMLAHRRHATLRWILNSLPADRGELGPFCEALDVVCMIYEGVDQRITGERALRLAERHDDDDTVRPLLDAALISPFYGEISTVVERAREAWERYADAPFIRTQLVGQVALVLWYAGEYDEVRRLLEPRVGLDQPAYVRVWTLAILSITASEQGDAELAERYGREAMAEVEAIGGDTAIEFAGAAWVLGEALRQRGKLEEARHHLDIGLENEARRPGSVSEGVALVYDGKLALAEGNRDRARRSVRRAREIIDRYDDLGKVPELVARLDAALAAPSANPLLGSRPTSAELEVLRLLDSNRTFAEIAAELYLTRETVKSHTRKLYRRLGVHSREAAVTAARDRGLLQSD